MYDFLIVLSLENCPVVGDPMQSGCACLSRSCFDRVSEDEEDTAQTDDDDHSDCCRRCDDRDSRCRTLVLALTHTSSPPQPFSF